MKTVYVGMCADDIHTGNYNIHWLEKWLEENMS